MHRVRRLLLRKDRVVRTTLEDCPASGETSEKARPFAGHTAVADTRPGEILRRDESKRLRQLRLPRPQVKSKEHFLHV